MTISAAVDVGNQRTKWAFFAECNGDSKSVEFESPAAFQQVSEIRLWNTPPIHWRVCSVSPVRAEEFQRWLRSNRATDQFSKIENSQVPLMLQVEQPEKVGTDRILACWGALQLLAPVTPMIVIDAGTAVTIDVVTPGREFLGGVIFPGVAAAISGLHRSTAQLPDLKLERYPDFIIGNSTERAIQAGVYQAQVGAIRYIAERFQQHFGTQSVAMTGGGIGPIRQELPDDWTTINDLVLRGIALLPQIHD